MLNPLARLALIPLVAIAPCLLPVLLTLALWPLVALTTAIRKRFVRYAWD